MVISDLITMYDYNYWANGRLMATLERLSEDEFTRTIGGGHDSIRRTLVHIMSAEWGWLGRCGGPPRGPSLNPSDFPTVESIRDRWDKIENNVRRFLARLSDADLENKVSYCNDVGDELWMPLGELMQHAANHSVHHRGQISLMMRMLGHAPEETDLLLYFAERRGLTGW